MSSYFSIRHLVVFVHNSIGFVAWFFLFCLFSTLILLSFFRTNYTNKKRIKNKKKQKFSCLLYSSKKVKCLQIVWNFLPSWLESWYLLLVRIAIVGLPIWILLDPKISKQTANWKRRYKFVNDKFFCYLCALNNNTYLTKYIYG